MENRQLRDRFHQFLEANYNPSLKALYKTIDVGYSDLCSWSKGSKDYGDNNLRKIEHFLKSKGF